MAEDRNNSGNDAVNIEVDGDDEFDGSKTIQTLSGAIAVTTDDLFELHTTGQRLEHRYADHGEIGRGGSSVIRKAFDKALLRETALKVLVSRHNKPSRAVNFIDEARLTGQLEHPSIVPVHELGVDDEGGHFFSMKLVQGQTLNDYLDELGDARFETKNLLHLLRAMTKVCEAVGFAHSRAVIHRDLKPENVMVGAFGQVYVMDWGIARILSNPANPNATPVVLPGGAARFRAEKRGDIVGTPLYMSPEQANGLTNELDERTDIFAIGTLLYYVMTLRAPYEKGTAMKILVQANCGDIKLPSKVVTDLEVPRQLERIAMKAMARNPDDRYQTCAELQTALETFARSNWYLPTRDYLKGSSIIHQGEDGDEAFIIVDGTCTVFRQILENKIVLGTLGPGEVFGEMAIFSKKRRNASVEAETDVEVMVVSADTLNRALGMNSWVGPFVTALAGRYRELDRQVHNIQREASGAEPLRPEDD